MTACVQIAVPAAVTIALGCMAAQGSRLTSLAMYGQPINDSIILGLFLGFSVLISLGVRVRTMEVGVIRQPSRLGAPVRAVRDIIVLTRLVYPNDVVP